MSERLSDLVGEVYVSAESARKEREEVEQNARGENQTTNPPQGPAPGPYVDSKARSVGDPTIHTPETLRESISASQGESGQKSSDASDSGAWRMDIMDISKEIDEAEAVAKLASEKMAEAREAVRDADKTMQSKVAELRELIRDEQKGQARLKFSAESSDDRKAAAEEVF